MPPASKSRLRSLKNLKCAMDANPRYHKNKENVRGVGSDNILPPKPAVSRPALASRFHQGYGINTSRPQANMWDSTPPTSPSSSSRSPLTAVGGHTGGNVATTTAAAAKNDAATPVIKQIFRLYIAILSKVTHY